MNDWGFVSGRLRALQHHLLTYATLIRWSEAENADALLRHVKDTPYADTLTEAELVHYDRALENHYLGVLKEIEGLVPDPVLVTLRKLPYDLNNLKIVLKSKMLNTEMNWEALSDNGTIPPEDVFTAVEDEQFFRFPKPYEEALKIIDAEYKKTGNLQIVDFYLDNAFNDTRYGLLKDKAAYEPVLKHLRVVIDLENIKNVLRAKKAEIDRSLMPAVILRHGTIPADFFVSISGEVIQEIVLHIRKTAYGHELEPSLNELLEKGGFGALEKQIDEMIMHRLSPFRYVSQGPEVVEEYLWLKNLEIKNLKILFIGKINNIAADEMKERIRQNGF